MLLGHCRHVIARSARQLEADCSGVVPSQHVKKVIAHAKNHCAAEASAVCFCLLRAPFKLPTCNVYICCPLFGLITTAWCLCTTNNCFPQMNDSSEKFLKKMDAYPHLLRLNDARNGVVVRPAPMKHISMGVLEHVHGMIDCVLGLLQSDDEFWKGFAEVRKITRRRRYQGSIH